MLPGEVRGAVVCEAEVDKNMHQQLGIKLADGTVRKVGAEVLRCAPEVDIGIVPRTPDPLAADTNRMSTDALRQFLCPKVLTNDEEEFIHWHNRLGHMSPKTCSA